jgi:sigma-B regulation protein RsbU (phosphoserine phosphatase)
MDNNIVQILKENLRQRKHNIAEFLKKTSASTISTRIGPNKKDAVDDQLHLFDQLLEKAENSTIGLCEICHEAVEPARLEMDYKACVCLEHLTGEERTRLENDLELSQKVQQALLPHTIPSIRGLDIAAFSQPARIVGGDYFDFLHFEDGAHAIAIADVMGKGMPASMLMSNLQASLRIITPEKHSPDKVISRLNNIFCRNIRLTKFVSIFLARFDEATRVLTYCNAGHNPPLVRHTDGSLEWLQPAGAAIGLIEQSIFLEQSIRLEQGAQILLYTDGVVESFNNQEEMFGEERLAKFFAASSGTPALQLITNLKETLHNFAQTDNVRDDTTIIAIASV